MRTLPLALLALAACASTPAAPQESAETLSPEQELKALERRYVESGSVRWSSESPVSMKGPDGKKTTVRIRTEAAFQAADRFRVVMTVAGMEGFAITVQSDGREFLMSGVPHGGPRRKPSDEPGAVPALRRFFARAGFIAAPAASAAPPTTDKPSQLDAAFAPIDVQRGETGRVGDRDAKSIRYRLRPPDSQAPIEVTAWLDIRSGELLRRDFRNAEGELVSETFSGTDFAATFPDGFFDLPKK